MSMVGRSVAAAVFQARAEKFFRRIKGVAK